MAKSVTVLFVFHSFVREMKGCARGGGIKGVSQDQDPDCTARGEGGSGHSADDRVARGVTSLLIELIFCLGSIWAKLELAFLASVIDYSMISMRFPLQIHAYPRRFCRSRMDQMNHTCTVM